MEEDLLTERDLLLEEGHQGLGILLVEWMETCLISEDISIVSGKDLWEAIHLAGDLVMVSILKMTKVRENGS